MRSIRWSRVHPSQMKTTSPVPSVSHSGRGALRMAIGLLLVTVTASLSLFSAGCDATTGIVTETYTDQDFGFSFEYPSAWKIDAETPSDPSAPYSKSVGAFDPDGSGVDDYAFDQVVVDVYEPGDSEPITLDVLKADFEDWIEYAQGQDAAFTVVEPIAATTVGGLQGYKATVTYTDQGLEMRSTEYWLLGDGLVYNLYTDSSEDNWDGNQGIMQKFIATFKP